MGTNKMPRLQPFNLTRRIPDGSSSPLQNFVVLDFRTLTTNRLLLHLVVALAASSITLPGSVSGWPREPRPDPQRGVVAKGGSAPETPTAPGTRHVEDRRRGGRAGKEAASSLDGNLETYLTSFGYLPQSDLETGALRTEEQLRDALRNLQFFAGLNASGRVDGDTLDLLKRPRCGVPDVMNSDYRNRREELRGRARRYSLQGQRWSKTNLSWSLAKVDQGTTADEVNARSSSSSRSLDTGSARRVLSHALRVWARHADLDFREVGPTDPTSDIQVSFFKGFHDDGYPFDGLGSVLAHAFFPGSGRGGDVHFDSDEVWTLDETQNTERYFKSPNDGSYQLANNLFTVAVHEFGHSLGLAHSSVRGSVMFPWYSHKLSYKDPLPEDDARAIQHLYGSPRHHYPDAPPAHNTFPVQPSPTPSTTTRRAPTSKPTSATPSTAPPTSVPPEEEQSPPETTDKCSVSQFDAISVIRGETWVFSGKYFWRIPASSFGTDDSPVFKVEDRPTEISSFWYGLPADLLQDPEMRIDAVYERSDNRIVFFIGDQFYVLVGNNRLQEGPVPLSSLGLPRSLAKLDGVVRWGWNDKTYLFSGSMYWRLDEVVQNVELDYPRDISIWKGVPANIDSVFKDQTGKTYFFKGRRFWEFDDTRMQVANLKKAGKGSSPSVHKNLLDRDESSDDDDTSIDFTASGNINEHFLRCPPRELIRDPFQQAAVSAAAAHPVRSQLLLLNPVFLTVLSSLLTLMATFVAREAVFF